MLLSIHDVQASHNPQIPFESVVEFHHLKGTTRRCPARGYTSPYLFTIWLDDVLRSSIDLMKENSSTLAKIRSKLLLAQTITDADYVDDIALLANKQGLAESLLDSPEKAESVISLHVNEGKTEYMCFNQNKKWDISKLQAGSLKLADKITYLGSSVLSTEIDINMQLATAWTSLIWRSDVSDKKNTIFPGNSRVNSTTWMHHMDAKKSYREKV